MLKSNKSNAKFRINLKVNRINLKVNRIGKKNQAYGIAEKI